MTSAAPVAPTSRPLPPASRATAFGRLLLSEWTKIRSVRSTVWTLIIFVVVTIGFTALFTWLTVANWTGPRAATRNATIIADPVNFILGAGLGLGQLAIAVLGALLITTEYSTGVILVLGEIISFGAFFIGSAILHSHVPVSLSDPGVARAVVGSGLYLAVLGLFALAIGALIRHTAGGISTVIGVVFVLPILSGLLPGSWGAHINAYLPVQAGTLIGHAHQEASDLLSPWQGFGVFCLWTAVLLAAAGYLLNRRDA